MGCVFKLMLANAYKAPVTQITKEVMDLTTMQRLMTPTTGINCFKKSSLIEHNAVIHVPWNHQQGR